MPFYAQHTLFNNSTIQCAFECGSYFVDSPNNYSYFNIMELSQIVSYNSGYTVTGINNYYISNTEHYAGASIKKTANPGAKPTITYYSYDDYEEADEWEKPKQYYLCIRLKGTDQGNAAHYGLWRGVVSESTTTQSFTVSDSVVANQSLQCSFKMSWNGNRVVFSDATMGLKAIGGSVTLLLGAFDAIELILSMGTVV